MLLCIRMIFRDVMTCADWFIYISIYVKRGSLFLCVLMFVLNDLLLNF